MQDREQTASRAPVLPGRDLTLQVQAPPSVNVASAEELSRPKPVPPASPEPEHQPEAEPAVTPPVVPPQAESQRLVGPAPEEDAVVGGRELAPGETVTVIPVSSGPSVEVDENDSWLLSERPRGILVGGGGTCRPRAGVRGIGIAGRIPVSVPTRHLR